MNNAEIAGVFREIADLLEKRRDNWFKIRAYRNAADVIEKQHVEMSQMIADGKLRDIPGIGQAIAKKVNELVITGKLHYFERLREEAGGD